MTDMQQWAVEIWRFPFVGDVPITQEILDDCIIGNSAIDWLMSDARDIRPSVDALREEGAGL